MTHSPGDIRELLDRAGASPRRSLGQNFVADPNTVRRIARLAEIDESSRVVEIGAGLGSLTLALVETGAEVVAVETDPSLVGVLREVVGDRARVVEDDARHLDWASLLGTDGWHLVANLPYNIATSLVLDVLDDVPRIDHLLVMVQKEAGDRLAATAGQPAYGAVSVRVAMRGVAELVGTVPPTVFVPRPAVTSALVRITRRSLDLSSDVDATTRRLLRQAFEQRRKMLRRSLSGAVADDQFDAAGIAPTQRPEELGLDAWLRLASVVCQRGD